ncbi:MAG: UvrD-helicase domain-containing protein [Clostridia bacterium]|nr:UvrD-helicase domain-containing protein [Clostridia bacterium]
MSGYDLNSLNEEQMQALLQTEGVVLVTAGAGSGKTRLLTHRICYLIEKGVSPYNILAITFTNKATNEMKERVSQMCDRNVWISTFHSMCVRILRENIDRLEGYNKNFTIIAENDRDKIVKELLEKFGCEAEEKDKVICHLESIKNKGLDIDEYFMPIREYDKSRNIKIYQQVCWGYEEYLRKNNALDFDDLLNKTLFLFQNFKDVLNKYAERFVYILVDEFQDTNLVQYKLVKLLASVHKNLFVVGDEDQCIYSWRGANFHNIFNLKNDFEDVKTFKLERNYRSSKNILNLANNVIANNTERMKKNLWTDKSEGAPPVVYSAFDERDEAMYVAKTIEKMLCEGYSYNDFAVLMRINALSRNIEEGLLSYQIPYKLYGGFKFYERAEIKTILAYLTAFVNPKDEIALMKIINFPKRGIGDVAISNLQEEAGEEQLLAYLLSDRFKFSKYFNKLQKFVETFKKLWEEKDVISPVDFVEKVIKQFGILQAYAGKDEEAVNRLGNIDSLVSSVQEFVEENEDSTLADYLANIMLKSDSDNIQENGFVSVATVHAVKGLEFKVVFVIGLEEGIFPLARASFSNSEMEEERRLMYVAITRAEENIHLIHTAKRFMYGKSNYQKQSRFLGELGIVDKTKPSVRANVQDMLDKAVEESYRSGFKTGDVVSHSRFGLGKIVNISDDGLVADIDFEDFGKKSLMLNLAKLEKVEEDDE